jgi:hypothetical protein
MILAATNARCRVSARLYEPQPYKVLSAITASSRVCVELYQSESFKFYTQPAYAEELLHIYTVKLFCCNYRTFEDMLYVNLLKPTCYAMHQQV